MLPSNFDDIRPYNDAELPAALARMVSTPLFAQMAAFLYPDQKPEAVAKSLMAVTSIDQLQMTLMRDLIERIKATTISQFTFSGLDNISTAEPHLFVSNHRDIVLDAFLLQFVLRLNGHGTNYITFGANLMQDPFVVELGKCNKMFRVERGGTRAQFYNSLVHLSEFIRYVLTQERQSLWTAQRNGRTKDGRDQTDPSILKMFARSSKLSPAEALAPLNITPVAVSYEWEPCDLLKTRERCLTVNGVYQKAPGEDLESILTGIRQYKGQVHIAIGKPLTLDNLSALPSAGFFEAAAQLLDRQIYQNYKLYPNNYIAHDLRCGSQQYASHYTDDQRDRFLERFRKARAMGARSHCRSQKTTNEIERLSKASEELMSGNSAAADAFLDIYANPVDVKTEPIEGGR